MPDVTIIDGRSGSGKTTLAARLAERTGARLLHLDDLYAGWNGLAEGSLAVAAALSDNEYRRYSWTLGAFAERVRLDPDAPLVIEGCGSLTRANLDAARAWAGGSAVRTIWMECPTDVRRRRALDRDGDTFRPHWDRWAAQEDAHFAAAQPIALAAEIVHPETGRVSAQPSSLTAVASRGVAGFVEE